MAKSTIISNLEELYKPLDNKWVNQNSLVINYAKGAGLSVGGSIAMAISNRKPHKIPGDFDFFTDDNEKSLKFIQNIIFWLSQRANTHYKIQFNTKTEFTLPGVSHHVRITVPFWKPICVMTLESPIRSFFYHGLKVQYFDDVVQAAKEATAKDGKKRITFDEEEARANIRNRFNADGTYDITCDSTNNSSEDIRNNRVNIAVAIDNSFQIRSILDPNAGRCLRCNRMRTECSCVRTSFGYSATPNDHLNNLISNPPTWIDDSVDTGENSYDPLNGQVAQVLVDLPVPSLCQDIPGVVPMDGPTGTVFYPTRASNQNSVRNVPPDRDTIVDWEQECRATPDISSRISARTTSAGSLSINSGVTGIFWPSYSKSQSKSRVLILSSLYR